MNDHSDPGPFQPPASPTYELKDFLSRFPELSAEGAGGVSLESLALAIARLEASMAAGKAEILDTFGDKLALDRFKEDQINRLHEELQAYRNNLIDRVSRQILRGVIRLHDDLGKVIGVLRRKPAEELNPEQLFQYLEGFQDEVELLLSQHGVERFEVYGEDFDPRRQTVLRTVPTEDPAHAGRVAGRLRPGFQQGDHVLQKQRVAVYAPANPKA